MPSAQSNGRLRVYEDDALLGEPASAVVVEYALEIKMSVPEGSTGLQVGVFFSRHGCAREFSMLASSVVILFVVALFNILPDEHCCRRAKEKEPSCHISSWPLYTDQLTEFR